MLQFCSSGVQNSLVIFLLINTYNPGESFVTWIKFFKHGNQQIVLDTDPVIQAAVMPVSFPTYLKSAAVWEEYCSYGKTFFFNIVDTLEATF